MANTTTVLHLETTELDEWIWWEVLGCATGGRKAFSIIWCFFVALQMMMVFYIIYTLIKNKPKSMRMTLCYLCFSLIYYFDVIIMDLNQCYGRDADVQYRGWYIRVITYAAGFIILLFMWFHRLYNIFKVTAYPLSKTTIIAFVVYIVTGLTVVILMTGFALSGDERWVGLFNVLSLVGSVLVVMGVLGMPGLYIRKLYMIMNTKKSEQTKANKFKLALLKSTSKNTILTAFTLFGSFLTFIVNFGITIFISQVDQYWAIKVQLTILLIDHTTNILGYVLGFAYTKEVYALLCGCLDKPVTDRIAQRLNLAITDAHENLPIQTGSAQNIKPQESTVTTTSPALNIQPQMHRVFTASTQNTEPNGSTAFTTNVSSSNTLM
eukprot:107977_1